MYDRNNIKISFNEEPMFFVNEEQKTVVCRLRGQVITPTSDNWTNPTLTEFNVDAIGKAKCCGNDVFDVNRGKRIALAKAETKAYLTALRNIQKEAETFRVLLGMVDNFANKAYGCCAHNEEYIQSLSYEAHPNYQKEVLPPKRGREC